MTTTDILNLRLKNQQLSNSSIKNPAELVKWFGAMQSQDLPAAKWAVHLRTGATNDEINNTYDQGDILRTHTMRPTWHFVNPKDIFWLQQLTSQKVLAAMRSYHRNFGIDEKLISSCLAILEKELREIFLPEKKSGRPL